MKRTPLKRKTPMRRNPLIRYEYVTVGTAVYKWKYSKKKSNGIIGSPFPKPRKRMRQASLKRAQELALYRKEARAFIQQHLAAGTPCPVAFSDLLGKDKRWTKVRDVHHKKGRNGKLLRDQRYWLAVSRIGHDWIHAHPNEARKRGWLI